MTNAEAIKMLKSKMDGHTDTSYEWAETVRMAIKALEQEPILDKIRAIVDDWKADTWTDSISYECMVKIAELVEPQESEDKDADSD